MPNFLALFMGSEAASARAAANPMTPDQMSEGIAAWGKWMADHAGVVIDTGGPLGKTKKASPAGVSDTKNYVSGYVLVRADSHEAAVRLFENHPHFSLFPGDSVEVMEVLPIPGA